MTYVLEVEGRPRAEFDYEFDDVRRVAQALANTEGVEVGIAQYGKTVMYVQGDENQYPQITLAERCAIVTPDVLVEMLTDAESRHEMQWSEITTITDELARRVS